MGKEEIFGGRNKRLAEIHQIPEENLVNSEGNNQI